LQITAAALLDPVAKDKQQRSVGFGRRDVDGIGHLASLHTVLEAYDVGFRSREDLAQSALEIFIGRIVRPKGENTPWTQMRRELSQARRQIQPRISRRQDLARRMVDIDKDRVKSPVRIVGVQSRFLRVKYREEIALDDTASAIAGQAGAKRQQLPSMPPDDFGQRLDHDQGSHTMVFQHRVGREAEAKSADDHVEVSARDLRQGKPSRCPRSSARKKTMLGFGSAARAERQINKTPRNVRLAFIF
jgi:hypothetical protein